MQKKAYTGVEIEVNIFEAEDVIVASSFTKPEFDGEPGSNDTEILG